MDFDAFGVLEDILAMQLEIGDLQLAGMHKGIGTILHLEVGDMSVSAVPEGLGTIGNLETFDGETIYLTEGFRGIDDAVEKADIAIVPKRCSIGGSEMAIMARYVLAFPDDVHAFELAIHGFNPPRFLQSGLPFPYSHTFKLQIATLV